MKHRTLTTIGLRVRQEILIKSHLRLVNIRTIDQWSFSDEISSDVAICSSRSTLAALTVKRSGESRKPLCVSLVNARRTPIGGTAVLHEPVHVGDLIDLLDQISKGVDMKLADQAEAGHSGVAQSNAKHAGLLARTLHELMKAGSHNLHLVEAGQFRFCVVPASRTVFIGEPLGDDWLERMVNIDHAPMVSIVPHARQQTVLSLFAHRDSLIKLLWHAGFHCSDFAINPMVDNNKSYSLKRWPDLGALKYEPVHLRMSAELSRKRLSVEKLAEVTRTTPEKSRAFLNACALCNLLQTDFATSAADRAGSSPAGPKKVLPRRSLGFLTSIRTALGLGTN